METLAITPRLSAGLLGGFKAADLRAIAINEGMVPMAAAALRCAASSRTSLGEVLRIVGPIYR